ncbi:hypothetical protein KEM55_008139 [Ascosphaera atra]|nr:hypothetical protein KEM55_008139 [Ascosphaera atra]
MSYGRKKSWGGRTGSTSSSTTSTSHSPEPVCASPYPQFRPPAPSMLPPTNTPQFEVPILPKPRQPSIISPQPLPIEQRSPSLTEGHMGMERPRQHYDVDIERLQRVYDRHRNSFWSVIASEYSIPGAEVPPQVLERAFFDTQCSPTVPPKDQPLSQCSEFSPTQVPQQRSFQQAPVNDLMLTPPADAMSFPDGRMSSATLTNATSFPSSMSSTPTEHTKKCTVSSLLTVERDVWQSKEIKAL